MSGSSSPGCGGEAISEGARELDVGEVAHIEGEPEGRAGFDPAADGPVLAVPLLVLLRVGVLLDGERAAVGCERIVVGFLPRASILLVPPAVRTLCPVLDRAIPVAAGQPGVVEVDLAAAQRPLLGEPLRLAGLWLEFLVRARSGDVEAALLRFGLAEDGQRHAVGPEVGLALGDCVGALVQVTGPMRRKPRWASLPPAGATQPNTRSAGEILSSEVAGRSES